MDIDGVVADVRHRLEYLDRRPKDWEAFFRACVRDPVLPEGRAVAVRLASEHTLIYLTGRPERWRTETESWLAAAGLPAGVVHMRSDTDRRPSAVVKVGVLRRLGRQTPIGMVVDDDPHVVRAVRIAGFPVLMADWMTQQPSLFEAQEIDGAT